MSTTDARRPVPAPSGGLRGRVARRPLTAFLVLVTAVGWPLMSVPALTAHGVLPGGALPQEPFALGTTLLVMLPAALWVTAVADGPGAVRALLRRAVQWRFGAGWWAAVLLALPVLTLAVGVAAGRGLQTGDLLATLASGALSVATAVLLVHLWEETVWAGFFQGRLEQRYGFLPAAALTAVPFALIHLPLTLIGDLAAGSVALGIGGLLALGVLMRLLVGATVRGAAGSLLAAGTVHATFNASNNEGNVVDDLLGGGQPTLYAVVAAALFTAGVLLTLRNRR
ncbi:CPBP family intramembrane glutamic endopeptidase [Geodermatophilus sp. URMC 61]|uniref:CPBP family intramembrane glutamic endopeptidase n=1 Tax=Geodermatophilus sp. URMC 61 TaxID=3423411 RepID=UPI00406C50AE